MITLSFGHQVVTVEMGDVHEDLVDSKETIFSGRCDYSAGKITISTHDTGTGAIAQTLLHEILHVFNKRCNLDLSESKIDALAYGLHDFILDNPYVLHHWKDISSEFISGKENQ
jgi:hypothetical protein